MCGSADHAVQKREYCFVETPKTDRNSIGRRNYKDEDYTAGLHHTETRKTPSLLGRSENIGAINLGAPFYPCNIVIPTMERQIRINVPTIAALRLYLTSISHFFPSVLFRLDFFFFCLCVLVGWVVRCICIFLFQITVCILESGEYKKVAEQHKTYFTVLIFCLFILQSYYLF